MLKQILILIFGFIALTHQQSSTQKPINCDVIQFNNTNLTYSIIPESKLMIKLLNYYNLQ